MSTAGGFLSQPCRTRVRTRSTHRRNSRILSVPFIAGGTEGLIPAVDVAMSGAYAQSQVAQLGLWK